MRKVILLIILIAGPLIAFSQSAEEAAVKKVVNNLFIAMRTSDTALLRTVFAPDTVLHSIGQKADVGNVLQTEKAAGFINAVGTPHKEVYDERIVITSLKIDGPLASVWAPYKFYVGTQFSHCGVDVFQLMKTAAGWQIIYIVDTRRKDNCVE